MKHIHSYYSPNDLYNKIIDGLNKLGKDLAKVTVDDLQPVDEFHIRGDTATKELIALSGFTPDMHVLDVGCGIGGSTRRLSLETACFDVSVWHDKTELAQKAFANAKEPVGEPKLPVLGVYLLVGNDIGTKAYNLHRNLDEGRVSLIEAVVVKPTLGTGILNSLI